VSEALVVQLYALNTLNLSFMLTGKNTRQRGVPIVATMTRRTMMDLEDLMAVVAILMVWSTFVLLAVAFLAGAASGRRRPVPSPVHARAKPAAVFDRTAHEADDGAGPV
jgi:hypothetical protein